MTLTYGKMLMTTTEAISQIIELLKRMCDKCKTEDCQKMHIICLKCMICVKINIYANKSVQSEWQVSPVFMHK